MPPRIPEAKEKTVKEKKTKKKKTKYEGMPPRIPEAKEKTVKEKTKKKKTKAKSKRKQFLRIRCPICFINLGKESVVSTKCGHVFCRTCLEKALSLKPLCPICRRKLTGSQRYHTLFLDENVNDDSDQTRTTTLPVNKIN